MAPNDRNLVALALQCLWDRSAVKPREQELLALVLFALVDALDFKGKLAHGFVRFVLPALQLGNVVIELPDVPLQEERLADEFKKWLEHGG